MLSQEEIDFIEPDKSLAGEVVARVTAMLGIPPCGQCMKRRAWLNRAHKWWRKRLSPNSPARQQADQSQQQGH